jgi:hypothetical protein
VIPHVLVMVPSLHVLIKRTITGVVGFTS